MDGVEDIQTGGGGTQVCPYHSLHLPCSKNRPSLAVTPSPNLCNFNREHMPLAIPVLAKLCHMACFSKCLGVVVQTQRSQGELWLFVTQHGVPGLAFGKPTSCKPPLVGGWGPQLCES